MLKNGWKRLLIFEDYINNAKKAEQRKTYQPTFRRVDK